MEADQEIGHAGDAIIDQMYQAVITMPAKATTPFIQQDILGN